MMIRNSGFKMDMHGKCKVKKALLCCLLMAAVLVCFAGCRDRITNRDDADKEVADKTGTMAADYEKRRDDLDLKETAGSVMKNDKKDRQEKKEQKKEQNEKKKEQKDSADSKKSKSKSGSNKNGAAKGGKKGKEKGKGKGKGEGNGGEKGNRKGSGENGDENNNNNNNNEQKEMMVTVSFDANGGNCVPAGDNEREYRAGGKYASFPEVKRAEYTFEGWYTEKDGGSAVNESDVVPEKDHVLYAHWISGNKEVYTLTFDPCEGRIKKREKTRQITADGVYGQMPLPVKTGYDFLGWFTEKDGGQKVSENDVYKEKGDQILYAHWEYNPYKYWSSMRLTIYESMYACQIVDCYIEFDDNQTVTSCSLLADAKIGNCARNRGGNTTVTDEWVESRNPTAIIKCKGSSSQAAAIKSAVSERFPGRRILVVPSSAVNGNDHERLFYTLALGKAIYPSWFEEVDLDKAGNELGVSGSVYE